MLKLSKKVEYGIMAMIHMGHLPDGRLATSKEISETNQIPGELLGKILQKLTRAGLVDSVQGSKGGYHLSLLLNDVSLGQVLEAVEGPVHLCRCQHDPDGCNQFSTCTIRQPVRDIQDQLNEFVHGIRLTSFCGQPLEVVSE